MKKRIVSFLIPVIAISFAVFLAGCASFDGPQFSKFEQVPQGKAIVYFYRPKAFVGGAVSYDVWVDGINVPFTRIYNGGYFPYIADPGKILFKAKTEAEKEIAIDAKSGEAYYIWCSVGMGLFVGRPHLEQVTREVAEPDIKNCRLLPVAEPEKK
jgi:hypothetical protein